MSAKLRLFNIADASCLPEIYTAAVSITARHHYTAAQITAWLSLKPNADAFSMAYDDGRIAMVIADSNDIPLGFADVDRAGHIQYFYCHPELSGTGLACELLRCLEASARAEGIGILEVEASETALGFFKRNGFIVRNRRDFEVLDVPIHNYAMEKKLD